MRIVTHRLRGLVMYRRIEAFGIAYTFDRGETTERSLSKREAAEPIPSRYEG